MWHYCWCHPDATLCLLLVGIDATDDKPQLLLDTAGCKLLTALCRVQTGSGKTFTLQGADTAPGVTAQSLAHLYRTANSAASTYSSCSLSISMLEIYNDAVHDLLAEPHTISGDGSSSARSARGGSSAGEPPTTRETPRSARKSLGGAGGASASGRRAGAGAGGHATESEQATPRLEVRSDASGAHVIGAHCTLHGSVLIHRDG